VGPERAQQRGALAGVGSGDGVVARRPGATGNVDTYSSIRAVTAPTSSSVRPSTSTPDSSSKRSSTASRSSRSVEK
jgi:hypothetical protein